MKRKFYEVANLKALTGDDDAPGTFEALVAVYNNVDRAGEVIAPGAFADTLQQKSVFPCVWSHQWSTPPIGVITSARETDEGLLVKGRLFISPEDSNDTARAVYTAMKNGALTEWSVGLNVKSERYEERDGRQVVVLEALELIETGPCLKGVNPDTYTVGVKAEQEANACVTHEDGSDQTGNGQEDLPSPEQKRLIAAVLLD